MYNDPFIKLLALVVTALAIGWLIVAVLIALQVPMPLRFILEIVLGGFVGGLAARYKLLD